MQEERRKNRKEKTDAMGKQEEQKRKDKYKRHLSKKKGSLVTPKGIKPHHHVKVIPRCGKYK